MVQNRGEPGEIQAVGSKLNPGHLNYVQILQDFLAAFRVVMGQLSGSGHIPGWTDLKNSTV